MKSEILTKKVLCLALGIIIALFCTSTVFAVGEDDSEGEYTEYVEPVTTEYVEPVTDPIVTEPEIETEPATEYTEPEVTNAPQTEASTDATDKPEETQEYVQNNDPVIQETTEFFEAPTLAKTVSNKHYTTNYTAGIVSWICVGIGVLAVAIVLISNKASGRENSVYK